MSVTIKDIALRTGLSIPTVGNVLGRASHRYSEKTRKLVLDAVREMGYRPNASARAMRRGRTGCAALVLSRSHLNRLSHIPAGLLDGLDDELAQHNIHLSVSLLTDEQLSDDQFIPQVLREYVADGMIVNYTHEIPPRMLELIHAHHTPAVWLNARVESDCVYPDDFSGALAVTEAMIARGHRRIAFVHLISPEFFRGNTIEQVLPGLHFSVTDRLGGYSAAMSAAGLPRRVVYDDRFVTDADMIKACESLLAKDPPTAVLLYSENETPAMLLAAERLKLSIPRDLTVMQFSPGDLILGGIRVPAVRVPTEQTGRHAVRMLLKKIESPDDLCPPEIVPYEAIDVQKLPPPAR